jgi:hypothetical protein
MAIRPECYPCLERLVKLAVDLATPDPEVRRQALQNARRRLDQEFGPDAIPATIANRLLRIIHHLSGNHDPFTARKAAATAGAARMYQRLAPTYGDDPESPLQGDLVDRRGDLGAGTGRAVEPQQRIAVGVAELRPPEHPPGSHHALTEGPPSATGRSCSWARRQMLFICWRWMCMPLSIRIASHGQASTQ